MQFINLLISLGATPAVMIVFLMGIPVAYLAWTNMKRNKELTIKYNQLDKLTLLNSFLITQLNGESVVKIHRNGDYEILNPLNKKDSTP